MTYTEKLNGRIDTYIDKVQDLMAKKNVFDGFFGLGHHPKNDPCHLEFYEDVKKMVEECVKAQPDPAEADELAETLLKADKVRGDLPEVQMMYIPIQGFVIQLVPFMSGEKKKDLAEWYGKNVPKRLRMPIQRDVAKALGTK